MRSESRLSLPCRDRVKEVVVKQNVIIVGANGSGKTRLGAWIEFNPPEARKVHRISAQKSLSMPESTSPISLQKAEVILLLGHEKADEASFADWKQHHRWHGNPSVSLPTDFDELMVYLFSEEYEQSTKYRQEARLTTDRVSPPETKIDIVKRIWEETLPHRELIIGGGTLKTSVRKSPGSAYSASEMSDGERVIFYLAGQCLAAPRDGVIVIDEPELHLHKSIQIPLWNELEKQRSDCLFVYITHDVDFAASKESSAKIWLKSYDGSKWDWEEIQQVERLPEDLLIEVMGSRRPVVFVEGESGSFDVALYRAVLKGFLVIPRGSSSQVIQAVKALRENGQLHHLEIFGIIDRDRRVDEEITALEAVGVFTLEVAEVENLFCTPEVIAVIAEKLELDPVDMTKKVEDFVFSRLQSEMGTQISERSAKEVKFKLNLFNEKAKGTTDLNRALSDLVSSIDIPRIYAESEQAFEKAIRDRDYKAALRLYNRKSLASQVGSLLGLKGGELPEYVVRLAKGASASEISNKVKPYLGRFAKHIA